MYTQPLLDIPPEIEAGLMEGTLKLFGGVVREADTGQIVKHLKNAAPSSEQVEEAIKKMNPKVVLTVVAVTAAVSGAAAYLWKKRGGATQLVVVESRPDCLVDFETSLRAYVESARTGTLAADVVDKLITDLDALKAYSEAGSDVTISFDELVPLFDLVIAHTSRLAAAYDVEGSQVDVQDDAPADGVVVTLRRHLEVQKNILENAA
jgi:hypothetical protein